MPNPRPLSDLLEIMRELRDPDDGCEWDRVQTNQSIAPYVIEEAYEAYDAIQNGDDAAMADELGDLLLQVVFHSQMASERGAFDINDVISAICDKMERRHPHIFGDAEQRTDWEKIKSNERKGSGAASQLDGVARALPSLLRAQKIQKRAARVGFDWPSVDGARAKVLEELAEVDAATSSGEYHEEIGDLLFAVVNLARHVGVDPERALDDATAKFSARFKFVEHNINGAFEDYDIDQLDAEWRKAKGALVGNSAP